MTGRRIDLNADMGEYENDQQRESEAALMAFVSSCSIACGGHAGDAESMRATARLARGRGVSVGAHPSYPDRKGFGRRTIPIDAGTLRQSLRGQIKALSAILDTEEMTLAHVKPHGALYNDAARDVALARLVVECGGGAAIIGPPGSALESAARENGTAFVAEGFVDRLYEVSGALTPRGREGAVIADLGARVAQARAIARGEDIEAADGALRLAVDTLCLHSDSPGAAETAKAVRAALEADGFEIGAFR